MEDGIINVNSKAGKEIGFISERFYGMSYLWKKGDLIIISSIASVLKGKGFFKKLIQDINAKGYRVCVPTPLSQMEAIMNHWGWEKVIEDEYEVYYQPKFKR